MDDAARKELVSRIERKEYVTYEKPNYLIKPDIILALALGLIYPALLIAKSILGKFEIGEKVFSMIELVVKYYPLMALAIFVIVLTIRIASFLKRKNSIYDLGNLSSEEKNLILQGDVISADRGTIVSSEKGSVLKCDASYDGESLHFESPAIRAQFLSISDEQIQVFIDKNNPKKYLVNIYNHIPRKGPKVLSDKTQLKYETESDEMHWAKIVLTIVVGILVVFFWPVALIFVIMVLSPFISMGVAIRDGDTNMLIESIIIAVVEVLIVAVVYAKLKKAGIIHRGAKMMRTSNYYLNVKVNKYWTTEYKVKGEHGTEMHKVHHISARYIEPGTNYVYDFFATGPQMISRVDGKEVRVFVDPDNMNKYYIDFIYAIRGLGYKYTDTGFTCDSYGVWFEK